VGKHFHTELNFDWQYSKPDFCLLPMLNMTVPGIFKNIAKTEYLRRFKNSIQEVE
jgi:hypothetical protein